MRSLGAGTAVGPSALVEVTPRHGFATRPHSRVDRIAVVGLGNVGRLIADMLVERGFEVWEVDADESRVAGERASVMDVSDPAALEELFADVDAVISCLPYFLNAGIATAAHSAGVHYLDLTEDVDHLAHHQGARAELEHDLHAALRSRPGLHLRRRRFACGQARDRRADRAARRRPSAQPEQRARLCVHLVS